MRRAQITAATLCIGVWVLARWVVYDYFQLGDTRVYEHAARMMDAGAMPYVDFDVEYPPLATGLFWIVARLPGGDYQLWFSLAMLACLVATAASAVVIAGRLRLSPARRIAAVAVIALTPVLLGTLMQTRYDLALSALLGWTLVAALHDRFGWAWTLLAVATAIKLVPVLLVPALLVWHMRRGGSPRRALAGAGAFAAGVMATFAPFALAAPAATWRVLRYHLERPPQIESLGSSVVLVTGGDVRSVNSYGSDNVTGALPDLTAAISTVLVLVCVLAVAWRLWRMRTPPPDAALVAAFAATVTAAVLFGKVLSPQYLAWLLPAVLLVPGRRGVAAVVLVVVMFPITQLVFPLLYPALVERSAELPVLLLAVRNALLAALVVAVWPRRPRGPDRTAVAARPAPAP